MILFGAACAACGPVEIDPVKLVISFDAGQKSFVYRLSCPSCHASTSRRIKDSTVRILIGAGARLDFAPPITEVEISRFRRQLDGDWRDAIDRA